MRSTTVLVIGLLVGAAVATTTLAAAPSSCRPQTLFQNEDVRVWFHGTKGFVKVFDTNGSDDRGAHHFDYTTGMIAELSDANETLAYAKLDNAAPQTSGCVVEETAEFVNLTLTTDERVRVGSQSFPATVVFSYHFNKTSHGAKFDLDVLDWPWQSDASELAFVFDVQASDGTLEPAENGIGYRDSNGTARGYIEWAPNATAYYADGHNETALVESETEQPSANQATVSLRFTNVTAGYERLAYDPWVGAGTYVVVGGVLVGLAPVEQLLPRGLSGALKGLL